MAVTCFSDEVKEDFESCCHEADMLLRDIITKKNAKADYADSVFFQQKLNWDSKAVNAEIRRMNNVLRLQAICGNPATREATEQEAATAAAVCEKEGPKLSLKIEELQQKLNAMERDARLAARRREEQSQAVLQLRELVPKHIGDKVNHAVSAVKNTIGQEISNMEIRINELSCCLDPARYPNQAAYVDQLQRSFRPAVAVNVSNGSITKSLSPEWPSMRVAIETELAELIAHIEPLKVQRAELIEQAERPLAFYADPANWEND